MAEKEIVDYMVPSAAMRLRTVNMETDRIYKDTHFHSEVEIIRMDEGEILCQVEETPIILEKGQILFIGQDVPHKIIPASKNGTFLYIQINIEQYLESYLSEDELMLHTLFKAKKLYKFRLVNGDDAFASVFSRFFEEFNSKKPSYELNLQAYVLNTIVYMTRNGLLPPLHKTSENDLGAIIPVLKYVRENYAGNITLDKISAYFNMSKYHFCRFFKKTTGMTLFAYINKVRLACAEKELIHPTKPIYAVALDCGFPSTTYFNSLFKKSKSISPKQFRSFFRDNDYRM